MICQLWYFFDFYLGWLALSFFHSQRIFHRHINVIRSIIGHTSTTFNPELFRHPKLSNDELLHGCRLGFDSWADTSCSGKHAYVESFVEGQSVTATGFTTTLGKMENLPIANVIYAYDTNDGNTILLENFHTIYLGENMTDSLINPIQAEDNDVRIDIRPKRFYPNEDCQCIRFPDGTSLPLQYDGVLPYLPVRRPTADELDSCQRLSLTSDNNWNPFEYKGIISELHSQPFEHVIQHDADMTDPIASYLHCESYASVLAAQPLLYPVDNQYYTITSIRAIRTNNKASITPEKLSSMWNIGLTTASRTLAATTHKCMRTTGLLARRFKTDKAQLRYKQLCRQFGTFYTDYLKSNVKSTRGYIGGTVYTNKLGFKKFYPCADEKGSSTASTLRTFIEFVGLPASIHSDGHKNYREGAFKRLIRRFGIPHTFVEPHSPWQNRAESAIGEIKRHSRRLMQKSQTPIRLWCYCYEYTADLLSLCATGRYDLHGRTPYEAVLNYTPDISEYVSYEWFQFCWYLDETTKAKTLCRWLGPAHTIGQSFCSHLLLANAEVIARSSVIGLTPEELTTANIKQQCDAFMLSVNSRIGNYRQPIYSHDDPNRIYFDAFDDDISDDLPDLPYGDEIADAIPEEIDSPYLESLDSYIGTNVVIPGSKGIEPVVAIIKGRKRDASGNVIGVSNPNPILDTRVYQLEFPDGRVEEYSMNVILENIMSQVDEYGYDMGIFQEICGARKDDTIAISKDADNAFIELNGRTTPVITTKGWDILIRWKDQSTSWVPLSIAKESFPTQIAEYAIANELQNEPAFNWWIKHCLRKRDHIIKVTKSSRPHRKGKMKFGVLIPSTVEEAYEFDKRNNNTLWQDAIKKEMENNRVAFEKLDRHSPPPPGHKKIRCHMNFEVKMDLRRKARYVAGGHLTDPPTSMTYSTVVSRESVRIAFLLAALNNLNLLAGDIQNAYLNAPTTEKLYFIAGKEWGADEGRPIKIVRALYGLKSSALAWRNHLSDILHNNLGFTSSLADPDVWYKASIDSRGNEYYSYILVYVDDILVIDENPMRFMQQLRESYTVREDTIKEPDQYLGADIRKVHFDDNSYAWTMGSTSYIKNAVKNIKARLQEDGYRFNPKLSDPSYSARNPFSSNDYRPELDTSVECTPSQIQFYQNIIGILRWLVELGRIDIGYEVSLLSSYLALPRTGHLNQALHIVKYLEIHHSNELTFDPEEYFLSHDLRLEASEKGRAMQGLYADASEVLPPNAPKPRGKPIQINCFVDSDHAGDRLTRRSHTGIIIYINKAPISWYSKKQTTVESSTFGSEFVALRIATEQIISLRYKLRMFGVPIDGFANVFCDNESVFKNASIAESRLKKKHNSVCFHRVREAVASLILMPFKVDSKFNLADILTKSLNPEIRISLRRMIMPSHT